MNAKNPNAVSFPRSILWLLLLGYFVLGVATMTSGHSWGDDWAQYVLHARNIVNGHPYADTGYLFNPDNPSIGPPSYPPGLPLLLAPVIAVFGINILALKIACFACVVLALPVVFRLLSASFGEVIALIAVTLFALHDTVWALRDYINSEAPYLLFSMLALWCGTRDTSHPVGSWSWLRAGILLGLLTYASVACRSIGVSLLVAMLLYGWAQQKPLVWFLSFVASFSLLVWLQTHLLVMPATYEHELKMPTAELVLGNLNGYLVALGIIFRMPLKLSQLASAAIIALIILGAWSVCVLRKPPDRPARGMRVLAARIPLVLWYLAAYLSALVLSAIETNARYLLPILPFVIALAATGVDMLARHLSHPRRYALPSAIAIAIYYTALHASVPRQRPDVNATCDSCQEMYAFVRTHTAPDTVVAFAKPRAMALLGGRASWRWSNKYSPDELRSKLRDVRASLLVVTAPGSALAEIYPASLNFAGLTQEPGGKVLFQNRLFTAIQLGAGGGKQ